MASPVVNRRLLAVIAALASTAVAGCSSTTTPTAQASPTAPSSMTSAAPSPSEAATSTAPPVSATTPAPPPSAAAVAEPPAFAVNVAEVSAADLGASYRAGCPVGPESLRALTMSYWGFDNAPHTGLMVVNISVVAQVETIFKQLYDARFPIRSMRPTSEFGGSDPASMDADNTSGFNCRNAVTSGPPQWSVHAYGQAIDINTVENPYVEGGTVMPDAGAAYTSRADVRPGMAVPGSVVNTAFAAAGWFWGGRWSDPDYQHFSSTGG